MTYAGSEDEEEMAHNDSLFSAVQPSPPQNAFSPVHPTNNQMAGLDQTQMMTLMNSIISENQRLRSESTKRPSSEKDEEEEGEPPIKLHIKEGHDDAWSTVHHGARNIRPYCGDWAARFKSLGKKAKQAKESLDWDPLGSKTISNATVKRMHDRGSILTLKMFWPLNHDVQSRNARIRGTSHAKRWTIKSQQKHGR